jgi:hypothetical protein
LVCGTKNQQSNGVGTQRYTNKKQKNKLFPFALKVSRVFPGLGFAGKALFKQFAENGGLFPDLFGGFCGGSGSFGSRFSSTFDRTCSLYFFDTRGLTAALTQIVNAGTTDSATALHDELGDAGGVEQEAALHADALEDLADQDGFADTSALNFDDNAFKDLDALFTAFNDADMNGDGVTGAHGGNIIAQVGCSDFANKLLTHNINLRLL